MDSVELAGLVRKGKTVYLVIQSSDWRKVRDDIFQLITARQWLKRPKVIVEKCNEIRLSNGGRLEILEPVETSFRGRATPDCFVISKTVDLRNPQVRVMASIFRADHARLERYDEEARQGRPVD